MKLAFKRKAIQYAGLRKLIAGLKQIASGETVNRALVRMEDYIDGRVKGELERHVWTGKALSTARIHAGSGSITITLQRYRRYIKWSWRKGIPLSALKRCQKIIGEEMQLSMKGGAS